MNEQLLQTLKNLFLDQERLVGRFLEFCHEFKNFEYDTTGINYDDADNIERKAKIIANKMIQDMNNAQSEIVIDIKEIRVFRETIIFDILDTNQTLLEQNVAIMFQEDGFEIAYIKVAPKQEEEVLDEEPCSSCEDQPQER